MIYSRRTNKPLHTADLLRVLAARAYRKNGIIRFPEISRCFSWFRIRKEERDAILYEMREEGLIDLIPYNGIKILQSSQEVEA